jgi:hypothetical protein
MANAVTQHQISIAKKEFIERTAAEYRAKASAAGIREISEEAWAEMMQARMAAQDKKA